MIDLRLGDCIDVLKTLEDNSVDSVITDPPYHLTSTKGGKKGFMGKEWDGGDIAFRTDVWKECLRVLKPGGYLLAFGSSRTYHRIAVAIEDAGFDIRDQIMWIYASGFPKSHNIGKSIQKASGDIKVVGKKRGMGTTGNSYVSNKEEYIGGDKGVYKKEYDDIEINNDWGGWGTALKPAHEPIVMARKPLSEKSIAENVLKWGTGGINIDGSRIPFDMTDTNPATNPLYRQENNYKMPEPGQESNGVVSFTSSKNEISKEGRFPANIMFDDNDENWKRYFYCPKASKKEKNEGLDGFEERPSQLNSGGIGRKISVEKRLNNNGENAPTTKNHHPTIKPIKLMEYLIKLTTRPGGVVLDCFMGSGTTGLSAKRNGYSFIGIEKEQEYFDIAQQRINYQLL
jgi:site-specific DNA-methyltransferase (adenine-specific)